MGSLVRQSLAMIHTNLASVPRRLVIAASMVVSVAMVVVVLLGFLAMANGFDKSLAATGSESIAVILSRGSLSEVTSHISREQLHIIEAAPGVARDDGGRPILSAELIVPVDATAIATGRPATLSLRGIGADGLRVRPNIRLVAGRMFTPGAAEIVVGARLAQDYDGLQVGETISFGRSRWTVVGTFAADSSVFESEVLADATVVQTLFNRQNMAQSVYARLQDPAAIAGLSAYLAASPQLRLDARSQAQYLAAESRTVTSIILYLGWPLAVTMALGAAIGAMTTMYSSVADRKVEIATVRAIGFGRLPAFIGTLAEAMALTLLGCALGSFFAWLALDGWTASTRSADNTQIVFQMALSWPQVAEAVMLALAVGLIGGGLPALRATRVPLRLAMSGRG